MCVYWNNYATRAGETEILAMAESTSSSSAPRFEQGTSESSELTATLQSSDESDPKSVSPTDRVKQYPDQQLTVSAGSFVLPCVQGRTVIEEKYCKSPYYFSKTQGRSSKGESQRKER